MLFPYDQLKRIEQEALAVEDTKVNLLIAHFQNEESERLNARTK